MSTSSMRQLIDMMDMPKNDWHREVSSALQSLITEAHALTRAIEQVERLDPRASILIRARLHGRLDEAGFGDMMGKLKGGVKTAANKAMSGAQMVNNKVDQLGRLLQNTKPVQNFDQQYENLKSTAAQKYPKLAAQLQRYGEFAKSHPKTQAFTIGVLTVVASLAGGPIGGAVAAGLLRAGNELLKGEKASTAIGKTVKTASVGWLAGFGIQQLSAALAHAMVPAPVNFKTTIDRLTHVSWSYVENGQTLINVRGMTSMELGKTLSRAFHLFSQARQSGNADAAAKFYKIFIDTSNQAFDPSGPIQQSIIADQAIDLTTKQLLQQQSDSFAASMKTLARYVTAGVQGAMAAQTTQTPAKPAEPFVPPSPPVSAGAPAQTGSQTRQPHDASLLRQVIKNVRSSGVDMNSAAAAKQIQDQYNAAGGTWQ